MLGGRVLKVPKHTVRPTQERVREAVFSSLAEVIPGASVLDLFSGTGALGIEAWSRGAARVTWVEQDPAVFRLLRQNVRDLCGEDAVAGCVCADAYAFAKRMTQPYDIILADPPYERKTNTNPSETLLPLMGSAQGTRLIFEQHRAQPVAESASWSLLKNKVYGDTRVLYYVKGE